MLRTCLIDRQPGEKVRAGYDSNLHKTRAFYNLADADSDKMILTGHFIIRWIIMR